MEAEPNCGRRGWRSEARDPEAAAYPRAPGRTLRAYPYARGAGAVGPEAVRANEFAPTRRGA